MKMSRSSLGLGSAMLVACLCLVGQQSAFAQTTPKLYSVARADGLLRELNPATGATVSSVNMILAGRSISGGTGLAADPTSGKFYALLRLVPFVRDNPTVRQLVTVDVTNGIVTDIGSTGGTSGNLSFADLAFDAGGTLYAVTGDGSASQPRTLFTINKTTGAPTLFMALGNGDDGESIAYNSDNGLLYHSSGVNESGLIPPPGNLFFESINLTTKAAPTRIPLSTATATAINEAAAFTYAGGGAFIWSNLDFNQSLVFRLTRVTTAGVVSTLGTLDHVATGLAFVPTVPTIASTTPATVAAGSGALTLTVAGTGFFSGSTVRWNGTSRATTYVSATQLTAAISAADVATAGTAQVTVVNPAPGGGTSAARDFSVLGPAGNPVPTITSTDPTSVIVGSGAFTLRVMGTGFVSGSTVRWDGLPRTTTFVSTTEVRAAISAADVQSFGIPVQVTVVNPGPGGGTSLPWAFSTTPQGGNPVPTITSISPSDVAANSGAFTLIVRGDGFLAGKSTVQWNGSSRPTTLVGLDLTAAISAADVATAGTAQVTVANPAPGGGISAARSFSITAGPRPPTVTILGPSDGTTFAIPASGVPVPIIVRIAVGGDQTRVTDFQVQMGSSLAVIRPPDLQGILNLPSLSGWQTLSVKARDASGSVVASASIEVFLFIETPILDSCWLELMQAVLGRIPVSPSANFPPRQALLSAAAELTNVDLDVFRAFRDNVLSTTPAGRFYTDVYSRTSVAVLSSLVRDPALALATYQALQDWTPAIRALVNQQGGTVTITPGMAAQAQTLLSNLRRSATGELATIMDAEIAALNPSTWSGLTVGQLLARIESQPRTPPTVPAPGRISNMSIRSSAGTGAQTLIVGAVIGSASPLSTKPLLIRGVGPALTAFGVPGALADPVLTVFAGSNAVASNDNWNGDAQVAAVGNAVGAFGLAPATSRDAALYSPALAPRDYTIQITGAGGVTGVVLAEIYDATPTDSFTRTRPQLVNVSARTQVGTGADILIAGFTLAGEQPRRLLIRAVGPTLTGFGVTGALADPQLALFSGTNRLQENNDWGAAANAAEVTAAATQLGTFQLGAGARDSAILTTLQPGSYTAQISGVGNTTGVALVEIYVLP